MADFVAGGVFLVLLVAAMLSLRGKPDAKHGFLSYAALVAWGIWLGGVFHSFAWLRLNAIAPHMCMNELKSAGLALVLYAGDYDDRLPKINWNRASMPFRSRQIQSCPLASSGHGYGLNQRLLGGSVTPSSELEVMMIGETWQSGPEATVNTESELIRRHSGSMNIVTTENQARSLSPNSITSNWAPESQINTAKIKDPDAGLWLKGGELIQARLMLTGMAGFSVFLSAVVAIRAFSPAAPHRVSFWRMALPVAVVAFVLSSLL